MTAPTLAPPQVLLSRATNRRHVARCTACPFEYSATIKADVEAQARSHRALHNGTRA